ncbi:MAG: hypothetical protein AAF349_00560, partial [Cyanobacteria bacterium P01_A01_bin.68]
VPAKYLGSEVNGLIAKLDDNSLEDLTIPVVANIGGNQLQKKESYKFDSPSTKSRQNSQVNLIDMRLFLIY